MIAFDFDRTLFDTERFKIALANSLKKYGIPPKIWRQTYKSSIPSGLTRYQIYQPEKHARIIQKLTKINVKKILDAFHKVIKQSSKLIYKETLPVLKYFQNKNFTLHLVSFGAKKHQMEKIKNSGIAKFFSKIIISNKPKASIKFPSPPHPSPSARRPTTPLPSGDLPQGDTSPPPPRRRGRVGRGRVSPACGGAREGVILVDDNILEIENLYKKYGNKIKLVWLNRENEPTHPPKSVMVIKNLKSLLNIF